MWKSWAQFKYDCKNGASRTGFHRVNQENLPCTWLYCGWCSGILSRLLLLLLICLHWKASCCNRDFASTFYLYSRIIADGVTDVIRYIHILSLSIHLALSLLRFCLVALRWTGGGSRCVVHWITSLRSLISDSTPYRLISLDRQEI